jgi:hypothetical protein
VAPVMTAVLPFNRGMSAVLQSVMFISPGLESFADLASRP